MPPKVAPPRPRPGIQRRVPRGRIDGSPAPGLRRSVTPVRAVTPSAAEQHGKKALRCNNPLCTNPNIIETEHGLVCTGCGALVVSDSNLVSEQGFGETESGRITALGVHVGESQTHQRTYAPGGALGTAGREPTVNRERSEAHAQNIMRSYQPLLGVRESEVLSGMQIFKLAWGNSFVQGRTIDSVAVVCLYLACRRKRIQTEGKIRPAYDLMLIDFAERLNIDVFALGRMYSDLVRKLYLQPDGSLNTEASGVLTALTPEDLVSRFVDALEFDKNDNNKIKQDAVRIVKRMNRDWMDIGRRPSGVCGAAVILAARMNNYRRTIREVVLTAKVAEITINKRLEEFSDTASSKLSIDEFRQDEFLNGMIAADPPSWSRTHNPQVKAKKKRGRPRKYPLPEPQLGGAHDSDTQSSQGDGKTNATEPPSKRPRLDAQGFAIPAIPKRHVPVDTPIDPALLAASGASEKQTSSQRVQGRPPGAKNWRAPPATAAELAIETEIENDIAEAFRRNPDLAPDHQDYVPPQPATSEISSTDEHATETPMAEAQSMTLATPPHTKSGPPGPAVDSNIGNTGIISLSPTLKPDEFDDDDDVSNCLLSQAESAVKERVWVTMNADWLRQDHTKRIRRELREAEMRAQGLDPALEARRLAQNKGKRKDGTKKPGRRGDVSYLDEKEKGKQEEGDEGTRSRSASEAMRKMMEARGTFSRRVNYDALNAIYGFGDNESDSQGGDRSRSASVAGDAQETREGSVANSVASEAVNIFRGNQAKDRNGKRSRGSVAPEKSQRNLEGRERSMSEAASVRSREASVESSPSPGPVPLPQKAESQSSPELDKQLPTPSPTQAAPREPSRAAVADNIRSPPLPEEEAVLPEEEALGAIDASHENTPQAESIQGDEDEDEDEEGDEDDYYDDDEDAEEGPQQDEDLDAAFEGRYHGREW
ncbi:hypothetical protein PV10_00806 [Exophiala mesophila]|uniref:Cyclin-like domain-containing protein n=1 Tax=Exophiala mesophila TaxID=212818 RepID=A0A0D1Y8H5_EXOME|nr:uncharacterized protein PV10_00806 [Exophiala mesophila]KIV96996.1 hypothetical protein PV10_00806 [Exophiala mesophila]